jgi:hypothetical protein
MADFKGSLEMAIQALHAGGGLEIEMHLGENRLRVTAHGQFIGDWDLDEVGIRPKKDGFHLLVEDEEIVIRTTDDAGFALAVGIRSAYPALRRHMAAAIKPGHDVEISPRLRPSPPKPPTPEPIGRQVRGGGGTARARRAALQTNP